MGMEARDAYERGDKSFGMAGSPERIAWGRTAARLNAEWAAREANLERKRRWSLVVTGSAPISVLRENR